MRRSSGRIRFSSILLLFLAALWCAGAHAQTLVHFDLPEQPLARSLMAIGTATNTDVGFSVSEVSGFFAPPLKADLTVDGALQRVLAGTGLRSKHLNDHTIVIAAAELSKSGSAETKLLPLRVSTLADAVDSAPQDSAPTASTDSSSAPEKELNEIVVTGSHIRGIANKTSPVIVIDQAQIRQSGYSSTQDLFRSLPQNFASGNASADGYFSGDPNRSVNSDFSSGVNLRGLGVSSTLVLLDGHRIAPSAYGTVVDVSTIPLSAIDRVEILTDGSSAIYGSDAVGGVVNIILKKDYQGADTAVRYGGVTEGSRHEELFSQTLGTNWSGGDVVGTVQYQNQSALPARDREFASALSDPNDLLPKTRGYSATLNGRQSLSDALDVHTDVLLSKREFTSNVSTMYAAGTYSSDTNGDTRSINISPGLRYEFMPQWSLELNGLYGQQKSTSFQTTGYQTGGITDSSLTNSFTEKSLDLIVNGHLAATRAGNVGIAIGTSYRSEGLNSLEVQTPGSMIPISGKRNVTSAFAEIYLPIVGKDNREAMVEALEFSAAVRADKYSDFGSTTNPRIGLRWAPWTDVALRASYGKSFRAPTFEEEAGENPASQILYAYSFANPAGPGFVPVLILYGSKPLTAERAQTTDFGIEYKPAHLLGLSIALNYYNILYKDRIIFPTFDTNALLKPNVYGALITPIASDAAAQAVVAEAEAAGTQYYDFTNGGTGVAGVRYLYDDQQQNAAIVRQTGFDFTSKYVVAFSSHTLITRLNISFIDKIDTAFAQGATAINLANTIGNPAKWRGRFDTAWASNQWSLSAALSFVGSYVNNVSVGAPSSIASWTTLDLDATINAGAYFRSVPWKGVSLSLIALNVLNRNPPYVNAPSLVPVNYDATNANPLGRFVAIEVLKHW
jgi:iron complex outermembrane recepter protein